MKGVASVLLILGICLNSNPMEAVNDAVNKFRFFKTNIYGKLLFCRCPKITLKPA